MLKADVLWPNSRRFKSRTEWEPLGFFSEALCNATQFDLKLGFFSSSAINVLADGFATFLYNGGKMRMIINDILSAEDKQVMVVAESGADMNYFNLQDLGEIRYTLSKRNQHFFECLAWLIRHDRIEIRVVAPKTSEGIAHSKCGVFSDGMNRVAFEGSCNFSKTALISNLESISAFCDWDGQGDSYKIQDVAEEFERTFSGDDDSVVYLETDHIRTHIVNTNADKAIEDLLEDEHRLIDERLQDSELPKTVTTFLTRAKNKAKEIINKIKSRENASIARLEPRFPYPQGPREYQQLAFERWKANKQKGLFAMATGTGKTITSLNCLLEIYKRNGYYKGIILVPTVTLVNQWEQECLKFNFTNVVKVFSKNTIWRDEIDRLLFNEKYKTDRDPEVSYVIISTYASFSRPKVFNLLNGFDKKRLLMIADECHNIGSESMLKRLSKITYLRRIGLSATPERQYDEQSNKKLRTFFGAEEQYTYEYSMEEAIKNGVLCRYMYYPHVIRLTDTEMEKYVELSEKIAKYFNYKSGTFDKIDDVLKMLLLARKRIVHKAANKLGVFKEIISRRFEERGNLKYTLVYVPEGNKPDYVAGNDDFDISDIIEDDNEADHLINIYTQAVLNVDERTTVRKFVSAQKDREEILADFAAGKLHVLTSMKCLDEGVDVPRSELAVFCSSTGNPRQFIQRRGRVLRTHPDKHMAELHDLVVAPEVSLNCTSYRMEQSLLQSELVRVNNFALLSENPSYSEMELRDVMEHYGLNLYNNEHIS